MKRLIVKFVLVACVGALSACGSDGVSDASNGGCPSGQQIGEGGDCEPEPDAGDLDGDSNDSNDANPDGGDGDGGENRDPWEDDDGDGVPNRLDNCPGADNPDQEDADEDGVGDACDSCPQVANEDQDPSVCDEDNEEFYDPARDHDDDGVPTAEDNCPDVSNPPNDDGEQEDTDGDGVGDACDNCPEVANYDQKDSADDGIGDACAEAPVDVCETHESDFEVIDPNIYIVLDSSGSMQGSAWSGATDALDTIADDLYDEVRFGLLDYPGNNNRCQRAGREQLAMGSWSADQIKQSYDSIYPNGGTPTGGALHHVRVENLTSDPSDDQDDERAKAVVLITDGDPNDNCSPDSQTHAEQEAANLYNDADIPVYVVGFAFGGYEGNLDALAQAGGTDNPGDPSRDFYHGGNDAATLVDVLRDISSEVISCSYELDPAPADENKIWVEIEDQYVEQVDSLDACDNDPNCDEAFAFDASSNNTLTLNDAACQRLQNADDSSSGTPLKISLGCGSTCDIDDEDAVDDERQANEETDGEYCDYLDNDCNGEIDEGCEDCTPEVCDGEDNNCNGEVDEGCPDCVLTGDSCETSDDCCDGSCEEGMCVPQCRPLGVSCEEDGECCGSLVCGGGSCIDG